jgi:hypothetical protein
MADSAAALEAVPVVDRADPVLEAVPAVVDQAVAAPVEAAEEEVAVVVADAEAVDEAEIRTIVAVPTMANSQASVTGAVNSPHILVLSSSPCKTPL